MSTWNEDELIGYCEKLIAKKSFIVAEEILWEMTKRNRSNLVVLGLLGRLYEETEQFDFAEKVYASALIIRPDDPELAAKFNACRGRGNNDSKRENLAKMSLGKAALKEAALLRDTLHFSQYTLDITEQQLRALRQQVWPEIAVLPAERWALSDADIDALTMGGKAEFKYYQGSSANHLVREPGYPQIYTDEQIDRFLGMIGERAEYCYRSMDTSLYEAIESYPINGLNGVVIGSLSPWYESICLHFGAQPTVADYTKIICKTERIKSISVEELYRLENAFDFAISISSIEHDGLGSYETPIEPDADLLAMRHLSRAVKPGGFAFFNVPVGKEKVTYPSYRTYGRTRFPKLIEGWQIEKSWGFNEEYYDVDDPPEPFFVLRNAK